MPLVLGLLFNDTVGTSVFTDQAGKTVTPAGGIVNAEIYGPIDCSGDIAAEFTSNSHQITIGASSDFLLPGPFSIGIAAAGYGKTASGYVFQLGDAVKIYLSDGAFELQTSSFGAYSLGINGLRPMLITRDSSNTLRVFSMGELLETIPGVVGNFGSSSDGILLGGGDFRGVIDDVFIYDGETLFVADYTPTLGIPEPSEEIPPYAVSLGLSVTVARRYTPSLPLYVAVADARVFESSVGAVSWSPSILIGGQNVSARATGSIRIEAEEDSARLAYIDIIPSSSVQLASFEGASVSVDITVTGGGYSATRRRFTGVVESVTFSAASRVASLTCRDQYQDRIRAAGTQADVILLLGGLETVSPKIVAWNDDEPDPSGYFSAALGTVSGATFIDGSGVWRVTDWNLGDAARTYTASDMFAPGPAVETAQRAELPSAVVATLSHRFQRLHNAELNLSWEEPERVNYITRGIFAPQKSMVAQALENLGDWIVKGNPSLASPLPGNYAISVGGDTIFYIVSFEAAPFLIRTMNATVYRRWYQDIERNYQVTVELGGFSGRDESIRRSIRSTFNASGWESGRRSEPSLGIYTDNAPPGSEDDPEPTGYEALAAPWPPSNSSMDHLADMTAGDVQLACNHVVAEATKTAAKWRRRQRVSFERPADLRLEIGEVAGFSAYGVSGKGQVSAWAESYDIDTGSCVGAYTFAAPSGTGTGTGFTSSITLPSVAVPHALATPTLSNHIGADSSTYDGWVNPDSLTGYLCNTLPTSGFYDDTAPVYETQFRIVLPEVPASVRDPAVESVEIEAEINLADSGLAITF